MQVKEVMEELKSMGSESTRKTLMNHGGPGDLWGVKIGDMKKIQKRVKKDYELSLALYDTGVSDAMYFAGLIADEGKMTKKDLQRWLKQASWHMISEYTVPWITAESKYGWELGLEWIESADPKIASSGWATLSNVVSLVKDEDLDLPKLKELLQRVVKTIHDQPNRVRHNMNGFVIALGSYVTTLTDAATKAGEKIGDVYVDMGGTACKVPFSPDYIDKVRQRGSLGKKKKMARC